MKHAKGREVEKYCQENLKQTDQIEGNVTQEHTAKPMLQLARLCKTSRGGYTEGSPGS